MDTDDKIASTPPLERVSVRDLAQELGCLAQSIHKMVERYRFEKLQVRDQDRRNQLVATISAEDAEKLRIHWKESKRRTGIDEIDEESNSVAAGIFYLMQLEPELDPGRVKVGFTFEIEDRLRKHRCVAPHIAVVKTWPCRRRWEFTAIDSITRGMPQLHTEVFMATSLEVIVRRADEFFALMPVD